MSLDETIPAGSEFRVAKAGKDLPVPPNEQQRLAALYRYNILDAPAEPDFDNLVTLAAQLAGVPVAMISLIDHDRQWFLAKKGVPLTQTPREIAFCAHTILDTVPVVVNDLRLDDRFSTNPLVAGDPHVVFYAGVPLVTPDGFVIGTVCLLHTQSHALREEQLFGLEVLARQVVQQLELRRNLTRHLEAEVKLRAILNSTSENNLLLGKDYKVLSFNKSLEDAVAHLYGHPLRIGQDFRSYIPEVILKDFEQRVGQALAGQTVTVERELTLATSSPAWYLVRYFPTVDQHGEIIGVTISISNIDESKRAELLIQAQNEQLLKIAHLQSHQIRGPVATILGLLQLLNRSSLTQENAQLIKYLEVSALKLDETIHRIVEATEKTADTLQQVAPRQP
ncbi:MAG: GAF domain-containing protein [Cytophagales bacterium]|nr:GAF domain-containing protein [Cytophagales bacterium]